MPEQPAQHDPSRAADIIRRLLQSARRRKPVVDDGGAQDFDWRTPYVFTQDQLQKLSAFGTKAMSRVTAGLAKVMRSDLPLEPLPAGTMYFREAVGEGSYYTLALLAGSTPTGLIRIDAGVASSCVEKLLGGAGKLPGDDRELSSLELSLLQDLISGVSTAFSTTFREAGGQVFGNGAELVKNKLAVPLDDSREMIQFPLAVKGQATPVMSVILPCELMDFVSRGLAKPQPPATAEQNKKAMLQVLNEVSLMGEVWFAPAATTMQDVLALEAGDVLLLPQGLDEPLSVTIQGRAVLAAVLGSRRGKYALEVREMKTGGT